MSSEKYQRRKRSKETITAITFQMEYVIKEYEVEMMLLSDEHGLVIAHAGAPDHVGRLFAAFASRLHDGESPDPALFELMPNLQEEKILVEDIELDGIPLYLTAVMTPEVESAHGFQRARTGILRIYRTT